MISTRITFQHSSDVSFRWWRVPMLPSLTWQKLCPASSPSNLQWWTVKALTRVDTVSLLHVCLPLLCYSVHTQVWIWKQVKLSLSVFLFCLFVICCSSPSLTHVSFICHFGFHPVHTQWASSLPVLCSFAPSEESDYHTDYEEEALESALSDMEPYNCYGEPTEGEETGDTVRNTMSEIAESHFTCSLWKKPVPSLFPHIFTKEVKVHPGTNSFFISDQ